MSRLGSFLPIAPELPDESLQGLSVAEAVAALGYLPSLSADKITISDTLEEIIENAHQFVSLAAGWSCARRSDC